MCACSRERQFVRKHNCPVNRFIYLMSQKFREKTKNVSEREERKNQKRRGGSSKKNHPSLVQNTFFCFFFSFKFVAR